MHFEILGELSAVETIATGSGIREIARLTHCERGDSAQAAQGASAAGAGPKAGFGGSPINSGV